jgi:hypothetical protein
VIPRPVRVLTGSMPPSGRSSSTTTLTRTNPCLPRWPPSGRPATRLSGTKWWSPEIYSRVRRSTEEQEHHPRRQVRWNCVRGPQFEFSHHAVLRNSGFLARSELSLTFRGFAAGEAGLRGLCGPESPGVGKKARRVSGLAKPFPGGIPDREQRPVRMSTETGPSLDAPRRPTAINSTKEFSERSRRTAFPGVRR